MGQNFIHLFLALCCLALGHVLSQDIMQFDTAPILYPGQVNIGLLSDIHGGDKGCKGPLDLGAVQRVTAAVWAAHQANFAKHDPQFLNIGVYIFDTCRSEEVAERQVYRLLGHVGHVQTEDCSDKKIPPLFAMITDGDSESLKTPMKLLEAFSVPVVATRPSGIGLVTTAPSSEALARAAVATLRHLGLVDVAVMAEDEPPTALFQAFTRQAQVTGMQAIPLDQISTSSEQQDFLSSLQLLNLYGKTRMKAVIFLMSPEQTMKLLHTVVKDGLPQIPWVVVTMSDISSDILSSFNNRQRRKLQQVLLLSPKKESLPEFDEYFRQLLSEDTAKYHPLLLEFLHVLRPNASSSPEESDTLEETETTMSVAANSTHPDFQSAEVSPLVKAVWALSSALEEVQRRSCRRGTDCLLYLRETLSSRVAEATFKLQHVVHHEAGDSALKGTRLKFDDRGDLVSVQYALRSFTPQGDIQEFGFYSDDRGLHVDASLLLQFADYGPEPVPSTDPPQLVAKYKLEPGSVLPTPSSTPSSQSTSQDPLISHAGTNGFSKWQILDDAAMSLDSIAMESGAKPGTAYSRSPLLPNEDTLNIDHHQENGSLLPNENKDEIIVLGPTYGNEHPVSSSNLRSISLTSHQEPRVNDAFVAPDVMKAPPPVDYPPPEVRKPILDESKVVKTPTDRHLSAWLGRPWSLSVLGICGFLMLTTLYILVFLLVKSCEGTLKKTNCCLAGAQLLALLFLFLASGPFVWKPSALVCGLQRLLPNLGLAFCYGCLLLKGMHLKAQSSLGLGGSVNRCNQLLTLLFVLGVQVALETQWWLMRPPSLLPNSMECSMTKGELLESQGYIAFLLLLSTVLALSARRIPYNQAESRSLIGTTVSCCAVFLVWEITCWLLPSSDSRNIAAPAALICTGVMILMGIFGPQLFAIHKYGGFPHKPLSYADSLSTVFTMFKDLDNTSSGQGTTSRGKKNAKTLETPLEISDGTRNPLYSDYQSAYP